MVPDGRDLMKLSPEQFRKWSRYGIEPYSWIEEDRLLASVYPMDLEYLLHLKEMGGISLAINLTGTPWPRDWITVSGIRHEHFPVVDMSVPSEEDVLRILGSIDEEQGAIMVHCAAGMGRTGTIMALYLVEKGMEPSRAISFVRQKRYGSIQTTAQENIIYHWGRRKM
ncbi:MAG: dual specificity protein phosphatase family protein [Thermoplasmatota archaeon]